MRRIAFRSIVLPGLRALLVAIVCASSSAAMAAPTDDAVNDAIARKDYAGAIAILQPLVDAGDVHSIISLSTFYMQGLGVAQDYARALELLESVGTDGEGMRALGFYYVGAFGSPRDAVKAVEWFTRGAAAGDMQSKVALGMIYLTGGGTGLPRQPDKAFTILTSAAAEGDRQAQRILASMYVTGEDIPRDLAEGFRLYLLSAEQGDPNSQRMVAAFLASGQGVPADLIEGYKWALLARELGEPDIGELLTAMTAYMTREQMDTAQARARSWLAAHPGLIAR